MDYVVGDNEKAPEEEDENEARRGLVQRDPDYQALDEESEDEGVIEEEDEKPRRVQGRVNSSPNSRRN